MSMAMGAAVLLEGEYTYWLQSFIWDLNDMVMMMFFFQWQTNNNFDDYFKAQWIFYASHSMHLFSHISWFHIGRPIYLCVYYTHIYMPPLVINRANASSTGRGCQKSPKGVIDNATSKTSPVFLCKTLVNHKRYHQQGDVTDKRVR